MSMTSIPCSVAHSAGLFMADTVSSNQYSQYYGSRHRTCPPKREHVYPITKILEWIVVKMESAD
jgi:hypothetical protein